MTENGIARAEIKGLRDLIEAKFAALEKQNNQQMMQIQQDIADLKAEIKFERNAREEYEKVASKSREINSERLTKLERFFWLAAGVFGILTPIIGNIIADYVGRMIP